MGIAFSREWFLHRLFGATWNQPPRQDKPRQDKKKKQQQLSLFWLWLVTSWWENGKRPPPSSLNKAKRKRERETSLWFIDRCCCSLQGVSLLNSLTGDQLFSTNTTRESSRELSKGRERERERTKLKKMKWNNSAVWNSRKKGKKKNF